MRIFLSSTCYDLIDLRAELSFFLKDAGVKPIVSDSLDSEFQTVPNRNSIEACLVNLRKCDFVLVILSNRYGPSLKAAGFEDLSATHLEYREAIKNKIPTLFYVRDRLEADYNFWRNNEGKSGLTFQWCKDERLFHFLDEHRKLRATEERSNWYWPFCDSLELKDRIAMDLKDAITQATGLRLFENGQAPFIEISAFLHTSNSDNLEFQISLRNLGNTAAIYPIFEVEGMQKKLPLRSLAPLQDTQFTLNWANLKHDFKLKTRLTYKMIEGHMIQDEGEVSVKFNLNRVPSGQYTSGKRVYVGKNAELSLTPELPA